MAQTQNTELAISRARSTGDWLCPMIKYRTARDNIREPATYRRIQEYLLVNTTEPGVWKAFIKTRRGIKHGGRGPIEKRTVRRASIASITYEIGCLTLEDGRLTQCALARALQELTIFQLNFISPS
jgi:hypothetical protein